MIKCFVAAAVLTFGLAGPALAQGTITGAPAGQIPETQANPASAGARTHYPIYRRHVVRRELHHPSGVAKMTPKPTAPAQP